MENAQFVPQSGRMPSAVNTPTLLLKPLALLSKLPSVAGVLSGQQQDDCTTTLYIHFKPGANYRDALQCFNVAGLQAKFISINPVLRFMKIKMGQSKQLLN